MFAPGVPQVMAEFKSTSDTLATFVVSVFVLGFAFGPLIIGPMSEIYGRRPVYNICNAGFVVFTILSAVATNMGMLIAVRFFAGVFGVAVITCGGGSISDMLPPEKRGRAMAVWSVGPILGPVIGPGRLPKAKLICSSISTRYNVLYLTYPSNWRLPVRSRGLALGFLAHYNCGIWPVPADSTQLLTFESQEL